MDISTADMRILKNHLTGANFTNLLNKKRLKKYRIAKACGVTYRTLLNWQKGIVTPSDENAIIVGRYVGLVSIDKAEKYRLKKKLDELKEEIDRLS